MQYETIILELLSRIKVLEDDVAELKNIISENSVASDISENESPSVEYRRTTDDMIALCYSYGKKFADGENVLDLANKINEQTEMNKNTAIMYLYAVYGMINGSVFKRAISSKAMRFFFNSIYEERGADGLKKAISATRMHIDYRRSFGHAVDSIERMCNEFNSMINE